MEKSLHEDEQAAHVPFVKQNVPEIKFNHSRQKTTYFLYFVVIASNVSQITLGLMLSWISPVSEFIQSPNLDINPLGRPVTVLELSIIGAAQPAGCIIGPIFGKCFDLFGRKLTLAIFCCAMTCCLVILAFSSKILVFCIMLFLIGLYNGAMSVGYPMYISEITEDHNRGKMSCLVQIGIPLGTVISFVTGPYLSVQTFTLICTIPLLLNILFFMTVLPESPVQLVKQKNIKAATNVLTKLRQKSAKEIEADIERIQNEIKQTSNSNRGGCSTILSDRSSRNGLIIAAITYNICVINGGLALTSYLQPIFAIAGTTIPNNICALSVTFVQMLCYAAATFSIEKLGRRKLILFSTVSSVIPLISVGLFFYFKQRGYTFVNNFSWFPLVALILYNAINSFGNSTAPIALMNDLFTNQVKAAAISTILLVSGTLVAITTFALPITSQILGIEWCFWIFAGNGIIASIFVYFLVPETTGKTLIEVQEMLKKLM